MNPATKEAKRWLARQHARIIYVEKRTARAADAPEEVVHRRVDGRTVIGRRLAYLRTVDPPLEGATE